MHTAQRLNGWASSQAADLGLGRLLILGWLLLWAAAVPLFHLHLPDTTDCWSLLQSGGAHTVLTPDLPGEYAALSSDSYGDQSVHFTSRSVNSPELSLVVFSEQAKQWEPLTLPASLREWHAPALIYQVLQAFAASRAPPRLISV